MAIAGHSAGGRAAGKYDIILFVEMRWARFFRIVNLPTVPGDVLAGAAAAFAGGAWPDLAAIWMRGGDAGADLPRAILAAMAMYLFGLAQNDIFGAKTDSNRPIPNGEISLRSAKIACAVCWLAAAAAAAGRYSILAYFAVMTPLITVYNLTKNPVAMGLCRAVGVILGAQVATGGDWMHAPALPLAVAGVWCAYIAGVTMYSRGEEADPAKKRRVGMLVGGIVYLQMAVLVVFPVKAFLLAGAALVVLLRTAKTLMPKVSAS